MNIHELLRLETAEILYITYI